jgi:hypothetical protein
MFKSKMRNIGISALLGAGLLAGGSAEAYNLRLGSVDIQIDTISSIGMTYRVADRETDLLAEGNGGRPTTTPLSEAGYAYAAVADMGLAAGVAAGLEGQALLDTANGISGAAFIASALRPDTGQDCGTGGNLSAYAKSYGTFCQGYEADFNKDLDESDAGYNYSSSINTDDGRLNFDSGDVTSAIVKVVSDIEADFGNNIRGFARVKGFYDMILDNNSSFERVGLNDKADGPAVMHLDLLDAYLDYDTNIGEVPVLLRVGKQVINWGESTFILGGNSAFSPIDVAAIRRPGAEIKEALLPVEAVYVSASLTDNLSVEAYVGGWDEFKLDVGGTPEANSDVAVAGSAAGGNAAFLSGGNYGFSNSGLFPCSAPGDGSGAGEYDVLPDETAKLRTKLLDDGIVDCSTGTRGVDVLEGYNPSPANTGSLEGNWVANDFAGGYLKRNESEDDDGDASYGIAVRYYAENLNSTEFGLYYQKYDSRIPYAAHKTGNMNAATITAISPGSSATTRGVWGYGCSLMNATAGLPGGPPAGTTVGQAIQGAYADIPAADPDGLIGAFHELYNSDAAFKTSMDDVGFSGAPGLDANGNSSLAAIIDIYCAMSLAQMEGALISNNPAKNYDGGGQLPTGALNITVGNPDYAAELIFEYPEIEVYGASFSTTLLGWGVQGEVAYRPEMPLSLDSDSQAIGMLTSGCAFRTAGGLASTFEGMGTIRFSTENSPSGDGSEIKCDATGDTIHGFDTSIDVTNWDIGTTATFTRSNPVISFLGADLGVLLTEFAGVYADGIDDYNAPKGAAAEARFGLDDEGEIIGYNVLFSSMCTSGSQIPLNSTFGLDPRGSECRPTENSYGAVLFGQLQYNNVFGTPIGLKPTFIHSEGLHGRSPSPAGGWKKGNSSTALSVNWSYLGSWEGSVAYRWYGTDEVNGLPMYSRSIDRDNVSLSVSRSF